MDSKEIAQLVVEACDNKQAENIVVLDMDQVSLVADYFIICHGNNSRQIQAIAREVKDTLSEKGVPSHIEGLHDSRWIVVEAGGLMCHIFHRDERLYYNLERLWGDASQIDIEIDQVQEG